MGFNPMIGLGVNSFTIDAFQQKVAGANDEYQKAQLGIGPKEQDAIRNDLAIFMSMLGYLRIRAKELLIELQEELKLRKLVLNVGITTDTVA